MVYERLETSGEGLAVLSGVYNLHKLHNFYKTEGVQSTDVHMSNDLEVNWSQTVDF